jgi:hypothetical protein
MPARVVTLATCAGTRPSTIVASTLATVIACELFWTQFGKRALQRDTAPCLSPMARDPTGNRDNRRAPSLIGAAAITEAAYLG